MCVLGGSVGWLVCVGRPSVQTAGALRPVSKTHCSSLSSGLRFLATSSSVQAAVFVIIWGSNRGPAPFLHSQSTSLCTRIHTTTQTHTSVSRVLITNSARVYLFDYNWLFWIHIDLFSAAMARGRLSSFFFFLFLVSCFLIESHVVVQTRRKHFRLV